MNMLSSSLNDPRLGDSDAAPVPFDVLRALFAARQAATPTCRLFAARQGGAMGDAGPRQLIDLFARGIAATDGGGGFRRDQAVSGQDEQHA
jgi:hypothetical protein